MHRPTIGVIALVLLSIAAVLWFGGWGTEAAGWLAASFRIGLVMAMLWLAEPQLRRFPPWALPAFGVVLVLAVLFRQRPIHFLFAIAILLLAVFVRPKKKKTTGGGGRATRPPR